MPSKRQKNSSAEPLPTDQNYWENQLTEIVETHFELAESRIPVFISDELKNGRRVVLRNFKYTAIDFLLLVYNVVVRIINLIARKSVLNQKESLTEAAIRSRFDELVFHSDELDRKIQGFFKTLDQFIITKIKERASHYQDGKIDPKAYQSILTAAIHQTTTFPDITKLIVVESAIPIFCSFYFANKITKGFGPVGAIAAQTYYKNQITWFSRPLYWNIFGFHFKEIPAYVTFLGSMAGFFIGLVLVAPLLNSIIEIIFSHFSNPHQRIVRQLNESKRQLLYASQRKRRGGATKLVFERLNILGEVLDYLKDMYLMMR